MSTGLHEVLIGATPEATPPAATIPYETLTVLSLLIHGRTEAAAKALADYSFEKHQIHAALSTLYRVNWEVNAKDPLYEKRILNLLRIQSDMEIIQFTPDKTSAQKYRELIEQAKRRWPWALQMEIAVDQGDLALFYFVALTGTVQDFVGFLSNTAVQMSEKYLELLRTFSTPTIQEALVQYLVRPKPEVVINPPSEPPKLVPIPFVPVPPINVELPHLQAVELDSTPYIPPDEEQYWSNIVRVGDSFYFACLKQYLKERFPTPYVQPISHNKATILEFILEQLQDYPSVDTFTLLRTRVAFPEVNKEDFPIRYRDILQSEGETLTLSLADALSFQRRPWAGRFTESAQFALSFATDLTKTQKSILFLEQTINRLKQANSRKPKSETTEKIRFLEAAVKHLEMKELASYDAILAEKIPGFHDLTIEESLKQHRGVSFFWRAPRSYQDFSRFIKTEREEEKTQVSTVSHTK